MAKKFWEKMTGTQLTFMVSIFISFGYFFEGYNQGNMGFVNNAPDYQRLMGLVNSEGVVDPTKLGGIVAIYYLGGIIGGFWGGDFADKYGRIKAMILGCVWIIFGGSLMTASQNVAWICCSRIIAGVGVGFFIAVIPTWSAEISNAGTRGETFSWVFVANFVGIFIAYWVGFGLSYINNGDSVIRWRLGLGLQLFFPIIMIPLMYMMPESPRWLLKQGRHEDALRVIAVLRGDGNPDHPDVKREYVDVLKTLEMDKELQHYNSYWAIITDYKRDGLHLGRRAWLAFGIQILIEVGTGTSLTTIYAPTIFKQAGFGVYKAGWLSGLNATMGVLGTMAAVYTCDRFGRRPMLITGAAAMGTCMWIFAGVSKAAIDQPQHQAVYGAVATAMILIFTFCLCAFWIIIAFIYAAEIFPTPLRAKGNGFLVLGWGVGFGSGVLWCPIVVDKLGYKIFYIFGVLNYVWIAVVWLFFPETAGRSLESIDLLFRSNSWLVYQNEMELPERLRQHEAEIAAALAQFEQTGHIEADSEKSISHQEEKMDVKV